ncbi:cell division ATP-binding protein FtsE [Alginatibacterium sediminis]|uniref:Cell division ATP-binding protein FtsE n=1 Tax=Alginatibacterium sediminis TaxID=2164068 RepID=A0A420ELB3_9ALTE|nr:cell division ATP-binding protein FtsE [Alginatibacterium sediminis]RKF21502.1 cell division ATP-binding protein FtsE [Alginatibacterium sediminis]
MIRFEQVSKVYPGSHRALQKVSFNLEQGQMAFLTGHSGAGKSTLLKLITAIERPSDGQVFIGNRDISRIKASQVPYLRRQIGVIFQDYKLLNDKTVFDNVALPLIIDGYGLSDITKRVHAALDKVGLHDKARFLPLELSGGEQQRVGIARAVVNKPALLIADEPTGNLDQELSLEIMRLFEQFNQVGVTVLIASHDLNLIQERGYPCLVLKQGQLAHNGLLREQL